MVICFLFFFFQAEDGIRDRTVTGVQTCALPIYPSVVGGLREGRAFHEVPRFERDHTPRRGLAVRMASAANPMEALGDGLGRSDLNHEIDVPDVDAELEGRRGDGGLELAFLQLLLDIQAGDLRQGAVVGLEVLDATLLQAEGDMLRPAPRVREDEGRPMLVDQVAQEVVHARVRDLHRDCRDVPDRTQDREREGLAGVDRDDVHVAYLTVRLWSELLALCDY